MSAPLFSVLEENEMKDFVREIQYKDKTYSLRFNLNVMEAIQEEYGSVDAWGELTDGKLDKNGKVKSEPNAKAVIFGFREMVNEGIDCDNEENGTNIQPLTLKQVGRMITDFGFKEATAEMNKAVIDASKSEEKN